MKMRPLISIIISTKNEEKNLERLLKSLTRQTYKPIEIIIVDNFSTDNTRKIAKKYTKKVYKHGHERSSQRNFGAKKAKGKYLLFLDADMELPKAIVEECMTNFNQLPTSNFSPPAHHPPLTAQNLQLTTYNLQPSLIIPETVPGTSFFSRIKRLEKKLYENEPAIEAARFFSKKVFNQVQGYNESLVAGEDWDLSQRVSQITPISRIKTPLYHYETSFIRELKHKWLYARLIHKYQKQHPQKFRQQSGLHRLWIILKKKDFYTTDPLAALGLIAVKTAELLLYYVSFFWN